MSSKLKTRINDLIKQNEWQELEELLLNTEDDWVLKLIKDAVTTSSGVSFIGGILTALKCKTSDSTSLRSSVYQEALKHLQSLSSRRCDVGSSLCAILSLQAEGFPSNELIKIVDIYVDHVERGDDLEGRWVDLLSKVILTIIKHDDIIIKNRNMCGEDYRYYIVSELCRLQWSSVTTTTLLSVFKELQLPKDTVVDVINKVERVMLKVDVQSIPPIVYHLMIFSCNSLPSKGLQVVINYFNKQEQAIIANNNNSDNLSEINTIGGDDDQISSGSTCPSDLREAQSTVVLHITHLAQYTPALVKDYLKMIKQSTWLAHKTITPFNLALTLSLASIDRYQEQILDPLKSCLLKHYRQKQLAKQSMWFRTTAEDSVNVIEIFKTTLKSYNSGCQVNHSFIQLAFTLLESGNGLRGESYPCRKTVDLAGIILLLVMKQERDLATTVLKQLSIYILTATNPLQYIDVLKKICKQSTMLIWEHSTYIRELFEQLGYMPVTPAKALLLAVTPLLKINMTLKDNLMLILRKLLFAREIEARKVALNGILLFLRNFRLVGVSLPSSQSSHSFSSALSQLSVVNVHSERDSTTNEALCLELLGLLRRCFTQQSPVRSEMYLGLYEVNKSNVKLSVNILSLLEQHAQQYLDLRTEVLNPVISAKIITVQGSVPELIEPLGDLISCIVRCKLLFEEHSKDADNDEDEEDVASTLNNVCSLLDILLNKMSECDLPDLEISKDTDFTSNSITGQKNILYTQTLLAVYDALIEYCFSYNALTEESSMTCLQKLFKIRKKVLLVFKDKTSKGTKKGESSKSKAKTVAVVSNTNISLKATARMLKTYLTSTNVNSEDTNMRCIQAFQDIPDFNSFLLNIIEQNIVRLKSALLSDKIKMLPHLKLVCQCLLTECTRNVGNCEPDDEKAVSTLRQSLTLLHAIISYVTKHHGDNLLLFMKDISGCSNCTDLNSALLAIVKRCENMISNIMKNNKDDAFIKDACIVLQIIEVIRQEMSPNSEAHEHTLDWVHTICKDNRFEDHHNINEVLFKLLFELIDQAQKLPTIARRIAKEIHHQLGDVNQSINTDVVGKYKSITEDTALSIIVSMMQYVEESLATVEVVLYGMIASLNCGVPFSDKKMETNISERLAIITYALYEAVQSAVPIGPKSDKLIVVLKKYFVILTLYVKYYLDLYKVKNYQQISTSFEKLIDLVTKHFPNPVYSFISYIESDKTHLPKNKVLTNRTNKEMKIIPNLVFSIENYEKHLILLSKRSKVDLVARAQLTIARDYKITADELEKVIEEQNNDDDNETESLLTPIPSQQNSQGNKRSLLSGSAKTSSQKKKVKH